MGLHLAPLTAVSAGGSVVNATVLAVEAITDPSVTSYVGAGSSALMASVILLTFRSLLNGTLVVRQSAAAEATLKQLLAEGAERERAYRELVERGIRGRGGD